MEALNAVTPTQLALICALFGLLLVWTGASLWLALRPDTKQQIQREAIRTPLQSLQIRLAVSPTQQILAAVPLHTSARRSEAGREVSLKSSS